MGVPALDDSNFVALLPVQYLEEPNPILMGASQLKRISTFILTCEAAELFIRNTIPIHSLLV